MRAAAVARKCVFVNRACDVDADEVPLEVCRLCLDAWKLTGGQVTVRRPLATSPKPAAAEAASPIRAKEETPVEAEPIGESLAELDRLFQEDKISLKEYLERRKSLVNSAMRGGSWMKAFEESLLGNAGEASVGMAVVKGGRVEFTYPKGWSLPDGFRETLQPFYDFCKAFGEGARGLRFGTEGFKVLSLGYRDGRLVLLLIDPSQRFEDYEELAKNAGLMLDREVDPFEAVPKIYDALMKIR